MGQKTKIREELFDQLVARGLAPVRLPSAIYSRSGQDPVHWVNLNVRFNEFPMTGVGKIGGGLLLLLFAFFCLYMLFRATEIYGWVLPTNVALVAGLLLVVGARSIYVGLYQERVEGGAFRFSPVAGDKQAFRAYMWLFPGACGNCGFRERVYASWSVDCSTYEDPYASETHHYSRCTRCGKPYDDSSDDGRWLIRIGKVVRASSPYPPKNQLDAIADFPYPKTRPSAASRWKLWKKRVSVEASEERRPTLEWLKELLLDDDWFVRLAAARSLAATSKEHAAQLLIALLRGEKSCLVREVAAEELTTLNWEPGSLFEEMWRLIASRQGSMTLSNLVPTSGCEAWLAPLGDALVSADPQARTMAAHALGKVVGQSPPEALLRALESGVGISSKPTVEELRSIVAAVGSVFGSQGLITLGSAHPFATDHLCRGLAGTLHDAAALERGKLVT